MIWAYAIISLILFSSLVYGAYKVGIEEGIKFVRFSRPETELIKSRIEVTDMLMAYTKDKTRLKEEILRNAIYNLMLEIPKYVEIKSCDSVAGNSTIYEVSLSVNHYKK